MHRRVPVSQIVNDRSHQENAKGGKQKSSLPIAEGETEIFWALTKDKNNKYQRNNEIQNDAVPVFMCRELVIIIHHQQQRGYNRNRNNIPIKLKFFAKEIFHRSQ